MDENRLFYDFHPLFLQSGIAEGPVGAIMYSYYPINDSFTSSIFVLCCLIGRILYLPMFITSLSCGKRWWCDRMKPPSV